MARVVLRRAAGLIATLRTDLGRGPAGPMANDGGWLLGSKQG